MHTDISESFEGRCEGIVLVRDAKGNTTDEVVAHYEYKFPGNSIQEATYALIVDLMQSLVCMKRDKVA